MSDDHRVEIQPRPKLLAVLFCLFFLWMAALLWMYFATVYPHRHPPKVAPATVSAMR